MQDLPADIRALYPFTSNYTEINNHSMHYLDEGKGPLVLCLHGNPTWSFYFRNVVKTLSPEFRVLVPDHMGMGLSTKPSPDQYPHTLMQRVYDMEAFLDAVAPGQAFHLIVHDWGGMIGTLLALRQPERISSFIITNTAGFLKPSHKKLPLRIRLARDILPLAAAAISGLNLFSRGALLFCAKKRLSPAIRKGYLFPYGSPAERKAQLAFVRDIPLEPKDPAFDAVSWAEKNLQRLGDIPKCILWGEKDFVFDTDYRDLWKKHFPATPCHSFPEAGHYLFEDETKACMEIIQRFLKTG
ncbi:alpha/beta fold hydrolase [Desulfobotulus mexicanus]|uniref:Alpha/beta fold hydrolase n=1 Tax=Desulfobotulus mexicanus TaxID=2586642 RepID=A0A5S5MFH1_9BACT|nr:alpha/beta fold hydrolase [Desulfobotulus mexicanus]TYT74486.1 alpha/beta fold hydrolase [Desulfobotulus mexicanus]